MIPIFVNVKRRDRTKTEEKEEEHQEGEGRRRWTRTEEYGERGRNEKMGGQDWREKGKTETWFCEEGTTINWENIKNFIYFSFIFISWRLITLQYCSDFCCTLTWISHGFTCVLKNLKNKTLMSIFKNSENILHPHLFMWRVYRTQFLVLGFPLSVVLTICKECYFVTFFLLAAFQRLKVNSPIF